MKLRAIGIISLVLLIMIAACGNKQSAEPQNAKSRQAAASPNTFKIKNPPQPGSTEGIPVPDAATLHMKRMRVSGVYVKESFPALKVENFTVSNAKGIVRLILPEDILNNDIGEGKIWYGDRMILIGTIRTENLEIPEIEVEKVQKLP